MRYLTYGVRLSAYPSEALYHYASRDWLATSDAPRVSPLYKYLTVRTASFKVATSSRSPQEGQSGEIPHSCYQRTGVTVVTLSSLSSNREVSHIWDMFTPVLPDRPTSTIRDHSNHDRASCGAQDAPEDAPEDTLRSHSRQREPSEAQ